MAEQFSNDFKKHDSLWWQSGIIYEIYPRSFQDSNGDGLGDIGGIISRLDYLQDLGINAVWIAPIYPSPMADFGYDISDYTGIHPMFGTQADFDELLTAVHRRGMKLILDIVPNHSSDRHPWFLESRLSRDNPKRDWYIWKDALPDGSPPNNWLAAFGGSAWEWDKATAQYYYHTFLKEQPDLNWRNPQVQTVMLDVMRYWLDRGVDGFRVDVMWYLIKDEYFRNNPVNRNYESHMPDCDQLLPVYSSDQPEVHDIVRMMRKLIDDYPERIIIGEIYLPIDKLVTYYGMDTKGAHLPFNFQLLTLPWDARLISAAIGEYEGALPEGGWPNWVLGNHDRPRIASRVGGDQARVAAILLLTLRGTPTIYYGEEIGMRDVPIPLDEIQDPQGKRMPDKNLSRDPMRTPMQWNDGPNAGFTDSQPWLRLARNFRTHNVHAQQDDPQSMLTLYKRLINIRQTEPALQVGQYIPVHADHQIIAYIRKAEGAAAFLVILNLTHRPAYFQQTKTSYAGTVIVATAPELEGCFVEDTISLDGDEGIVVKLVEG
jgi:alpha-glucosidase